MKKRCGKIFFSWPEAFQAGVEAAGGKGWNLGRLERYGFKVPAGGVLAAGVYQDFIEENNLLEAGGIVQGVTLGHIGEKEIEEKLSLVREKIKAGRISLRVQEELFSRLKDIGIIERPMAVRSSATAEDTDGASFAGIHESFLNVRGMNNILSAIKGCYASLWTPRAVAYRRKMNLMDDQVLPAVVIMEMVAAKAAGVGFSCEPRIGREDVVLISANFGLGESVVNGAVETDEYLLNHRPEIIQKRIGRKAGMTIARITGGTEFVDSAESAGSQVLTDENIRGLSLQILRAFDALGCGEKHQDIEWVFDGERFFLLQARPVTALPRYTMHGIKKQPAIWCNTNFREVMPMVQSTLNWSLKEPFLNAVFSAPFRAVGYQVPQGLQLVRKYQGRAYLSSSSLQWLFYDALGVGNGKSAYQEMADNLGEAQPLIEIKEKKPYLGMKGCKRLWRLLRLIVIGLNMKRNVTKYFSGVDRFTGQLLEDDFNTLTEIDLIKKFVEIRNTYTEFIPVFLFGPGEGIFPLVKALEKTFPGKGKAVANTLMAGKGDITSAQHGYLLVEMARIARGDDAARKFFSSGTFNPVQWEKELPEESPFRQSMRSFLAEYGHRGVYELDIINPRWREDPSYILHIIRSNMETADPGDIKVRRKEKANAAWRAISQRIPFYRRGLINNMLKQAIKSAERREAAKSMIVKIFESERLVFQAMGGRLAERGILIEPLDIYHCTWNEIFSILKGDWDGRGLDLLVTGRKAGRNEMEALSSPDWIIDDAPYFAETAPRSPGNMLTGLGVSAGKASGAAKLLCHPEEGEKLQAGDVLVAPSTDPGWTPLFLRASAIVMGAGGVLSHGAIVAREYGIPAVVNIPGVMKIINDGQLINVDGDEGKVYL